MCSNCGRSTGNRAIVCKSCGEELHPGKPAKKAKTSTTQEVTSLCSGTVGLLSGTRVFSCRVRGDGPDFRTFVTEHNGIW